MQPDILDEMANQLSGLVTEKQARAIVAHLRRAWGGEACYIQKLNRQARNAIVQRELAAGHSIHAAAKAAGCSRGAARRVMGL